jgi:hypothetical protein
VAVSGKGRDLAGIVEGRHPGVRRTAIGIAENHRERVRVKTIGIGQPKISGKHDRMAFAGHHRRAGSGAILMDAVGGVALVRRLHREYRARS